MGSTGTKKKNKNAFKKVYPYVRRRPIYTYELENETVIETVILTFSNESTKTYVFDEVFSSAPTVTAISAENEAGDNANVNVFVSSVTTSECTINTSDEFSGYVHIQIMLVVS